MYEDILFDKSSYQLLPDAKDILVHKAQWLQKNPNIKVIVEGHTDEAGTQEYNFVLGDQRAGAVKSFLIGQGIQSARLIAVSYGMSNPSTIAARQKPGPKIDGFILWLRNNGTYPRIP